MRSLISILLISFSITSHAVEKIPMAEFLRDIRQQFRSGQVEGNERAYPDMIRQIHIEMHVIAEKDKDGNIAYYVPEGLIDKRDVVTQKLSFDLELRHNASMKGDHRGYKTYSTKSRHHTYGPDRYRPYPPHPYHPEQYRPDIYPVILYDKGR